MTNQEWINSLDIEQDLKDKLNNMANIAAGFGSDAIQINLKLKELQKMTSRQIQRLWWQIQVNNKPTEA